MAAMPTESVTRRFAAACGVLSQYVRTTGAPAMTPPPPFLKPAAAQETTVAPRTQQLTIFYGGRVVVLDACPADKADELIRLAASAAAAQGPLQQPPEEQALVDMPIARKASLRRFLAKRKDRWSSASSTAYDDRRQDDDDEEAEEEEEPPAPKKGKMAAAAREDPSSSSWLALGSMCSMHGRADEGASGGY